MWLHVLWFILKILSGFPFANRLHFRVDGRLGCFQVGGFRSEATMDFGVKVSADVGCRFSLASVQEWSSAETEPRGVSAGDAAGQPCRVLCHLPPHRARSGGPCRPPALSAASAVCPPDLNQPSGCDTLILA